MHITYKQTTPRENNLRKFKQKREALVSERCNPRGEAN